MSGAEFYKIVHDNLFKTGSCVPNVWVEVEAPNILKVEAMYPSKGNIRVRKVRERNSQGQVLTYSIYKFNKKKDLIFETYDYQVAVWEQERVAQV